jgi:hypothetical protein
LNLQQCRLSTYNWLVNFGFEMFPFLQHLSWFEW